MARNGQMTLSGLLPLELSRHCPGTAVWNLWQGSTPTISVVELFTTAKIWDVKVLEFVMV